MGIAGAEESGQLGDIAGEGGQVVLNALIIPDDGIEMVLPPALEPVMMSIL